jgi:glucokinase
MGCGFPGIVDFRNGVIGRAPHYPTWKGVPFRDMLEDAFDLPVVLDNDANMTAVGEMLWGAAKGMKNFVMITLGTGIGGGIVVDGELYRGEFGYAGEIGHQVIERRGVRCDCGSYGCWEEYAAAGFLKKRAGGGKLAEELARARDPKAMRLWEEFGRNLGVGINNLINVLGITNFVIGGGVARAADLFFHHARAEIKRRAYPQNVKRLKLVKSKLIDAAGVLGSAAAAFKELA